MYTYYINYIACVLKLLMHKYTKFMYLYKININKNLIILLF